MRMKKAALAMLASGCVLIALSGSRLAVMGYAFTILAFRMSRA